MMPAEAAKSEHIVGAAPAGAGDQSAASQAVREMFTAIAPRYDLLNHVLSCNVDRLWWWRTARTFKHILQQPEARVLDLCCGTGDMTLALLRQGEVLQSPIIGADFSHAMLQRAAKKTLAKNIRLIEADALQLPLPDERFDLVVSAFGFRNLANYDAGLQEILRVLKPGGEIGILDFGEPKGLLGKIYRVYFRRVLPFIGSMISGVRGPYAYLPASVERFPEPEEMLKRMRAAGFRDAVWKPYSFGIAGLFRAKK
ncbi:MAG TPA: bifunctional demethylmenaquinone methyltransferase/2-methoxy-6-polyprenyl-1,4-benzoquinol methylase UbiE [Terriglobales bacterium]|jgi:demethylmenaquinone methyltransferase/2-methoxy-6-polyprenyl-1,4-benzoquinol methylase|nr:bifunctional demethylmenaquinone methyltransferase/2-methoxy-6-polyprenyl-1,4-benzoquinol methylase UbiE [Terriglobales bacterium]